MDNGRNKQLKVAIGIFFGVLLVIGLVLVFKPSHSSVQKYPTGLEKGSGTNYVGFNGTYRLNQILLPQEFSAVEKALSNYIRDKISGSVVSADIVSGTTMVNNDSSIDFSVQVAQPNKTFNVVLQRPDSSTIIFSVTGSSAEPTTLYPFDQP